ncbi:MAG: hypothetical protein WBM24_20635 [Candidatus Sulfotelmatobacter sp.]
MIICIDVSQRTKDQLEKLLEAGAYRDYSEAVAVAIANQVLLHSSQSSGKVTTPDLLPQSHSVSEAKNGTAPQTHESLSIPDLFSQLGSSANAPRFAPYPENNSLRGEDISVDRWIFGQHNKLLPVKATCRALARLMSAEGQTNLALAKTASEIASEAVKLGDYFRYSDERLCAHRDDAMSFAFPFSDSPNGDKSRLRYANQFVASLTKQGTLAGLPIELKLVNRDQSRTPQILLTEAGWLFAMMRNPILDDHNNQTSKHQLFSTGGVILGQRRRFSDEEIEFLLAHIRDQVPAEAFAYKVVLEAIAQGANTPDKLDDALEEYLPKRDEKPFTRAFLTTQRAGVVSRMADLGLIHRIRDGIKVTYTATAKTFEFSPNPLRQVV